MKKQYFINKILLLAREQNKEDEVKNLSNDLKGLQTFWGGSLINAMLFNFYLTGDSEKINGLDDILKEMIIEYSNDINEQDKTDDTILHLCTMVKNTEWLVEWLLDNFENLDVNIVNDLGYTPFGNALRFKNENIAKIIARRKDLKPTESDLKAFERIGYNKEMFGLV